MSPELLAQYLDVLKAKGAVQAGLESPIMFDGRCVGVAKLSVVFGPDPMPPGVGVTPTPGGWKGGTNDLDQPALGDESIP